MNLSGSPQLPEESFFVPRSGFPRPCLDFVTHKWIRSFPPFCQLQGSALDDKELRTRGLILPRVDRWYIYIVVGVGMHGERGGIFRGLFDVDDFVQVMLSTTILLMPFSFS